MTARLCWLLSLVFLGGGLLVIPFTGLDLLASRSLLHACPPWEAFSNAWGYLPWRVLEWLSLVFIVGGLIVKRPRVWRSGLFLLLMGFLVTTVVVHLLLKPYFGRPRPFATQTFGGPEQYREWISPAPSSVDREVNHSFPSGHAAAAAAALAPFWVIARPRWRGVALALGLAWWFYVSAGRVMMNVHFVSDTLASLWLTVFFGGLLAWLIKPLGIKKQV